jgi:hypothetical protein
MIAIASRFCGPPDSGNGGYSAGLLATHLSGSVEVTLRSPPPLERPLNVVTKPGLSELLDGQRLVAEARTAALELEVPAPPSFERASALSRHYIGYQKHHFPRCFVCGPARAAGDGLRIFPGGDGSSEVVAGPWIPGHSLLDARGTVGSEFVWAALDCVGYFATAAPDYPVSLLGRMTAEVVATPRPDEQCVVIGWPIAREGRKLHAGTAVFGQEQRLLGRARQTWILVTSAKAAG